MSKEIWSTARVCWLCFNCKKFLKSFGWRAGRLHFRRKACQWTHRTCSNCKRAQRKQEFSESQTSAKDLPHRKCCQRNDHKDRQRFDQRTCQTLRSSSAKLLADNQGICATKPPQHAFLCCGSLDRTKTLKTLAGHSQKRCLMFQRAFRTAPNALARLS